MSKPPPAKVLALSGRWKAKPPKSGGGGTSTGAQIPLKCLRTERKLSLER